VKNRILEAKAITKSFVLPDKKRLVILENLSLQVVSGSIVAITGASGSGKSTLLHLLGSLDQPDQGDILFDGHDVFSFKTKELNRYRNRTIGFVFQFHYLMPELTVLENVAAPALIERFQRAEADRRARALLAEVELQDKLDYMPYRLSGGEKQRAAIARSLINSPRLLLADEPTGNLDWKTGEQVFALFRKLIRDRGLTAVVVTHNPRLAELADRRYLLQNGTLKAV